MNKQLEYLVQLQEIDLRIRILDQEIARLPEEIERLRQGFLKEEKAWETAKERLDELEKERRKKERELESAEAKLGKYNTQLLSVRTNKEYTAMLHEIQQSKDEISTLEEEILKLFDQIEESQLLVKEEEQKVHQKKKLFEEEKVRIEAKLSEVKKDRDSLIAEKNEVEKGLEKGLMKEYQKIVEVRNGLAVARAEAKDNGGSCIGCHIMLMPQLFQEIKTDEDKIFRCPNCHRILFHKKDKTEE